MDLGACPRVHSLYFHREYEEAKVKHRDNYDRKLEKLRSLFIECDWKITRALKCFKDDDAKVVITIVVLKVTTSLKVVEVEVNKGKVDRSRSSRFGREEEKIRVTEQVEELRAELINAMMVLEAFNKDMDLMPQFFTNLLPLAPLLLLLDVQM
eukprot:Gb_15739 [translate_table: standard]